MFRNVTRRFFHVCSRWAKNNNPCAEESSDQKSSKKFYTPLQIPEGLIEFCDLQNGMRIIAEQKESPFTTLGIVLPAGSMYETPEERGAALFMEHLMFRKTECRQENEIEEELREIGGKITTIATRDMFLFYGTAPNEGVDKLIELFADATLRGWIRNDDFIHAKLNVITQLSNMCSKHEEIVMDYLPSMAYQETELSKSIYPETAEIKKLSQDCLEKFRKRLFKPNFMTMISTGGASICTLHRSAEKYFLGTEEELEIIDELCTLRVPVLMPNFRFSGGEMRLRNDDGELGHVAIAIEGPGYANCEEHCTLTVAKELVGSWNMSSAGSRHNAPNIAKLAFNSGLCHVYKSFNIGWSNTGLWGCYFACDRMNLSDMVSAIQQEWMRICTSVNQKEVQRAINQCKTKELLKLSDPIQKFLYVASSLFHRGYYDCLTTRIMKYDKVTANSLKNVADQYIYDQCPAVVAIGPVENLPDYNITRAGMYLLRY